MTSPLPVTAYAAVSHDGNLLSGTVTPLKQLIDNRVRVSADISAAVRVTIIPTEQYEVVVDAFNQIDALDPESKIHACSADAVRGLVLRMGEIARTALAALKEQDHG